MSNQRNDGGYVFPLVVPLDEKPGMHQVEYGITRRDWLAALAMQGLTSSAIDSSDNMHPTTALEIARNAYHLADIMIRVGAEDASAYRMPMEVSTGESLENIGEMIAGAEKAA
ncbi:MAG TPA: hypothetical protein VGK34_06840 [Armatimonadota bacterium]|jgi:hypothetical protein